MYTLISFRTGKEGINAIAEGLVVSNYETAISMIENLPKDGVLMDPAKRVDIFNLTCGANFLGIAVPVANVQSGTILIAPFSSLTSRCFKYQIALPGRYLPVSNIGRSGYLAVITVPYQLDTVAVSQETKPFRLIINGKNGYEYRPLEYSTIESEKGSFGWPVVDEVGNLVAITSDGGFFIPIK